MPLIHRPQRGLRPQNALDPIDMVIEFFSSVFDAVFGKVSRTLGPMGCTSIVLILLIGGGVIWYFIQQT